MSTFSKTVIIEESHDQKRLDQALAELFPDFSRTLISQWIKDGSVTCNDQVVKKPRYLVSTGDEVSLATTVESQETWKAEASPTPLPIIKEDPHFLIINKPAEMVVHPGAGNHEHTLINYLLHQYPELNDVPRCGVIHRIDKDTTGLIVVARTPLAHQHLTKQLQDRDMKRTYLAICKGHFVSGGTINAAIGRNPNSRLQMSINPTGRPAVTHYEIMETYRGHSLMRVKLETGRTHQIRVHFTSIHHPLACDPLYGKQQAMPKNLSVPLKEALHNFKRQALHAAKLSFAHPVTKELCEFKAPIPDDLAFLIEALQEDASLE
jgi:23S rRNA pseudouridine1911/1915/1917 synthase